MSRDRDGAMAATERRVEILKSAAAAFRRRGYHGASVDEIASALEMTKGNLYYYFRNKEDILYACHEYSLDILLQLMREVQGQTIPADEKLRKLILAFVHLILDELQGTALTLDPDALSPPLLGKVIAKRDEFDRGMRAIIRQGMDEGLFARSDPKMMEFAIMGAVNWISKWFDPAGPMSSQQIGEAFANYLVGQARVLDARLANAGDLGSRSGDHLIWRYSAVWPGSSSSTSIPVPARCCLSISGVPVSSGNVPQCIGTTCRTPSHFAAVAAVSGPMVKRSPIGRKPMSGL